MYFKIFFFLIIVALSSNSHAQWWVDGGNLIWPHGTIYILKGLDVSGNTSISGTSTMANISVSGTSVFNGPSTFSDDIVAQSGIYNSGYYYGAAHNYDTYLRIVDGSILAFYINGIRAFSINSDGYINLAISETDSNRCDPGDLYIDPVKGTVHRKF